MRPLFFCVPPTAWAAVLRNGVRGRGLVPARARRTAALGSGRLTAGARSRVPRSAHPQETRVRLPWRRVRLPSEACALRAGPGRRSAFGPTRKAHAEDRCHRDGFSSGG